MIHVKSVRQNILIRQIVSVARDPYTLGRQQLALCKPIISVPRSSVSRYHSFLHVYNVNNNNFCIAQRNTFLPHPRTPPQHTTPSGIEPGRNSLQVAGLLQECTVHTGHFEELMNQKKIV